MGSRKKVTKKTTKTTPEAKEALKAEIELAFDLTKQTTKADWAAFEKGDALSLKVGEKQNFTVLLKISNQLAEILKHLK